MEVEGAKFAFEGGNGLELGLGFAEEVRQAGSGGLLDLNEH
jgi:hypothetical protein